MIVEKNGKAYIVKECKVYWSVTTEAGALSVSYKVDKEICKDCDALSDYIQSNDMF